MTCELPAGLDHDGGGRTADQGRAGDPVAGEQGLAGVDGGHEALGRLMRRAGGEDGRRENRLERMRAAGACVLRFDHLLHGADALDRHRFHDQAAALDDEAVA